MSGGLEDQQSEYNNLLRRYLESGEKVPALEELLLSNAASGGASLKWHQLKDIYIRLLTQSHANFVEEREDSSGKEEAEVELLSEIKGHLSAFNGIPFTIQRITELLLTPREHYTNLYSYLKAMHITTNIHGKTLSNSRDSIAYDEEYGISGNSTDREKKRKDPSPLTSRSDIKRPKLA